MNIIRNVVAQDQPKAIHNPSTKRTQAETGSRRCAALLRKGHTRLTKALIEGITAPRENRFGEAPKTFEDRVGDSLNLLIRHLEGMPDFGALYAGQRLSELYRAELSREENLAVSRRSVEEDGAILRAYLEPMVSVEELSRFEREYQAACAGLVSEPSRHVRTLFIGDCLLFEITSFLTGALLAEGISIDPYPINSFDPIQLRKIVDRLPEQQYDVIFFSPFSHERLPELGALMNPANQFMRRSELRASVSSIQAQTKYLLDYLSQRFECPIFVHNAALLHRSGSLAKAAVQSMLSRRTVAYARERINQWLADYVALHNSETFQHLFVLDENAIASRFGPVRMGRFLHDSPYQHATVFSQKLALEYHLRISAISRLLGKKLVICDLDNTLWDGIIGEGPVSHFEDRQSILKRLKGHGGIVLSIASKNDPANVTFDRALLSQDDFVAPQISWGRKSEAIARIKRALNLQTKHMVFLDDRGDERALVKEAFPDVLTLDSSDPDTWRRLDLWADLVHGSSDLDRTRLYQEQAQREASAELKIESDRPDGNSLKKLELVISLRRAEKGDLKRVAELINRTNQWNLCGSRTTYEQMRAWHSSSNTLIMLASAADRFGAMGTVCVAVVTTEDRAAEIGAFVLSCRVFGYGIETAMLNEICRRCGIGQSRTALIGRYRVNNQNHLCRDMYADHGFAPGDGAFVWDGTRDPPSVPWATILADP